MTTKSSGEPVRITGIGLDRIAWIDSDSIEPALSALHDGSAHWLGVNCALEYKALNLNLLERIPSVERLIVTNVGTKSLDPLYELKNLVALSVRGGRAPFNVGRLPKLQSLDVEWYPDFALDEAAALRSLELRGYRPPSRDLEGISHLLSLEELSLVQGNVKSLEGIGALRSLRALKLAYLRSLQEVDDIVALALTSLFIERCPKVPLESVVPLLGSVRKMCLFDLAPLRSLSFIAQLPHLEEFRFVGTAIEDGDLTPLLRLKRVGFTPRRGYSHSPDEIEAAISSAQR